MYNVIVNKKGTSEWFICNIDGREASPVLSELAQQGDLLKLYEKSELESQYFVYYTLKGLKDKLTPNKKQTIENKLPISKTSKLKPK